MKYIQAHLKAAKAYAELSKCERMKVGAVITKEDRIISVGFNGCVAGGSNICEDEIDGELVTRKEVIHAEYNAIAFAAKHGTATNGCSLILTHAPCIDCARLIVQSGIVVIYYEKDYRKTDGIEFLNECMEVRKI